MSDYVSQKLSELGRSGGNLEIPQAAALRQLLSLLIVRLTIKAHFRNINSSFPIIRFPSFHVHSGRSAR